LSAGSGGGSSIIAAYAVIRNLIRPGRSAEDDAEQAQLDSAELRQVEYESMGMSVPNDPPTATARSTLLGRLRRSLPFSNHRHGT
jgi:hypothetical protein